MMLAFSGGLRSDEGFLVRLRGGLLLPQSPTGAGSFVQSYASTYGAGGMLGVRRGNWRFGLDAVSASFQHLYVSAARVDLRVVTLIFERAFRPDPGSKDGLYAQLGLGYGGAEVLSPYPGVGRFSALAAKLALGYRLDLWGPLALDLEAASWGLAGGAKRDGLLVGSLGLGIEVAW